MKVTISSIILLLCSISLMAQQEKISFTYDSFGYKTAAQRRFVELYSQDADSLPSERSTSLLPNKFKTKDLVFISIPILGWKNLTYRCGDNIEPLIAFKQDFLFQEVIVVRREKGLRVKTFEIFDSFNEENRKKDSINNVQFSLVGRPIMPDRDGIEKRIHKYCLENPNVFVFMLRGLDGYYAVIKGEFVKLVLRGGKIKGVPGSEFICKHYGQEFVNDAITDGLRTGYIYLGCSDCKVHKPIMIEIVKKECEKQ